ncbi:IclR family transcriptional regulator [Actibacterium mucosum KCTC 23349]|uniref:IclR family transcriptional regulator n=1 Tax=Actibacterium mucosum KCTC 23349 TaxID=1454373 RepID=A0A037ZIG5_9RHOB|nr:IclR family transcriptional regulator [Actibacterium mucosum]KAJ55342.1 IclR family transcriptional regulator [Actibacterium mucosum KCTC 23349]
MSKPARSDGTVGKALEILDLVASLGRPVRFTELLEQSDHPKATLYRFLQTLTNQNMLSYDPDTQTYALGVRLVRLAHAAWAQSSLAPVARPFIDALAQETGETVHLAQMEGGQVLYVDKRNAANPVEMFSQAGKVGPGYCTGVGKAIMAFMPQDAQDRALSQQAYYAYTGNTLSSAERLRGELEEIRADGISYDREEHEPGIICIAAPILSGGRRVIGALSITTTTTRNSLDGLNTFRPALTKTAKAIGTEAANWQFPTQN